MEKFAALLSKAKSWSINTKAIVITAFVIILLTIICIVLLRINSDSKTAVEIEKLKPQIEKAKTEAAQKASDLRNSVTEHDKSVQDKVQKINKQAEVKPFKPMKHEIIKVKSSSYNAMRAFLDTVQPIK
jgi:cell division protein FtsL